jgi:hypothetical protein
MYLAGRRMRLSFGDGELRVWGEKDFRPGGRGAETPPLLEFYLFCADPYFMRAGEIPVFRPGREVILLTVSGRNERPDMEVAEYGRERQAEVAEGRKKYFGSAFGAPPLAIVRFAPPGREAPAAWRMEIPARRVHWVYRVRPRPAARLSVRGACGFRQRETEDAAEAVFVSDRPLPLTAVKGIHLMFEDEQGQESPLMENLASPHIEHIVWDEAAGGFIGTVRVDLGGFGAVI